MCTEEQHKDAERLRRYIQREQLVSVMNDTKWRELQALMADEATFSPRWRVKCVRDSEPSGWDTDWCNHLPYPFKNIEWVDIDPVHTERVGHIVPDRREDRTGEIERLLEAKSIPYDHVDGCIRVQGYLRPTA